MSGSRLSDRIEIVAETKSLALVRDFLRALIERSDLPGAETNRVVLAVDEAVANTIEHGFEGQAEPGRVTIEVEADNSAFRIRITDAGAAFDVAEGARKTDAYDIRQHVSTGRKRGLGLFIMRRVMDEVHYQSKEGSLNILTLVKYIRSA